MSAALRLMAAAALALSGAALHAEPLAYQVLGSTPSQAGSFDYVSVEQPSGRVFIGRSFGVETMAGGRMTMVLTRKVVAPVLQIGSNLLLTTNRGMNTATLLNRSNARALADLPTGTSPDGTVYDEASRRAFVMNGGSKDITVIDVPTRRVVARIPLGVTPEAGVVDARSR